MLLSTGVVVAIATALAIFMMPARLRLALIAALSLPQLILPGLIESASVFQTWVVGCGIMLLLREKPRVPSVVGKLLALIAGLALFAALWSPLQNLAVIAAIQVISLLVIAVYAAHLLQSGPTEVLPAIRWLSVGVVVEAALVVAFRVRPDIEAEFLASALAKLLIGTEKMRGFFAATPDNVMDPAKAGGLWLNANTASMFLGVAACALVFFGKRYDSRWFHFCAAVAAVGVCFAGSKTGLILIVIMPLVAVLAPRLTGRSGRKWILPAALAAYPLYLLAQSIADAVVPASFATESEATLGTRTIIWDVAALMFAHSPYLGLGFGGWGVNFYAFSGGALGRSYPPHNILIAAWADYGMAGLLVITALIVTVVWVHFRRMDGTTMRVSSAWGFSLAAFLWLWIHGMADVVTFFGDIRTITVVGILLGFMIHGSPRVSDDIGVEGRLSRGDLNLVDASRVGTGKR